MMQIDKTSADAGGATAPEIDLDDPSLYENRELAWLEFNQRVLSEAFDDRNPLLERVRFLAITASNLDEFFMVRVSGLKQQQDAGVTTSGPDGMDPTQQLHAIDVRCKEMLAEMASCWIETLEPLLAEHDMPVLNWRRLRDEDRATLSDYFRAHIFPVLTPLAVDPAHPFPYISNQSLSLAVAIRDPEEGSELFARVKVPDILPRFTRVPGRSVFVPLEQLVSAHLEQLFPGMEILAVHPFRVVRDADFEIEEDEADDLMQEIEAGLRERRFRSVVQLTVGPKMPERMRELLMRELQVSPTDVYVAPMPLGLADLSDLVDGADRPDLLHKPWRWQPAPDFVDSEGHARNVFTVLRKSDVLVHHPYQSFTTSVEEFIRQAVNDPKVLAIKTTLYRTSSTSSIMRSLIKAAETGKQVVVVIEIKARFDEEANIAWAKRLEAVGAHVTYGVVGLKTHAKAILVVRQEGDGIRRYVHVGTGNYNASTARIYEDLGLFTSNPTIGADMSDVFNFLTGYSRQRKFHRLLASPYSLRNGISSRIDREIENARQGAPARIRLKENSLLDAAIIRRLYQASRAGVDVDIIVRGICAVRAGVPGVSENIHVRSVIGRFLEHSRIYHFGNKGRDEYLIGSADLMERNLDRRVETIAPVLDPELQARLDWILRTSIDDKRQAWILQPDGRWTRTVADVKHRGPHAIFMSYYEGASPPS